MEEKKYHHGNLENELIEAGIHIINESGIESFSLRKVAKACGVSHSAPYKHFKDVNHLLESMGVHVQNRFARALSSSLEEHEGDEDRLIFFAQAYLAFFKENPHYLYFFIMRDAGNINLSDLSKPSTHKPFEVFRSASWQELEIWGIPVDVRQRYIISMWGMVHGITMLSVMQNINFEGDWLELIREILSKSFYDEETK